jgi:hypothetical protein
MGEKDLAKENIYQLLQSIPPSYSVGTVYLNGAIVPVASFSNFNTKTGLAYFINAEGKVVALDAEKIDGLAFGAAEEPEEPEEPEEA